MEFVATQPIAKSAESSVGLGRHRSLRVTLLRVWDAWPAFCAHSAVRPLVRALGVSAGFAFLYIAALSFAPDDDAKNVEKPTRLMRSRVVVAPVVALRPGFEAGTDTPLELRFFDGPGRFDLGASHAPTGRP